MNITIDGTTATCELEEYADLLAVRTLPDYRFVGEASIECDAIDLELLGHAPIRNTDAIVPASYLFDYQAWIVERAVRKERFAVFADTGLGKTAILLDWARIVTERHHGRTLIVCPLNVVAQTINEATRFYGDTLPIADLSRRADLDAWLVDGSGLGITNYEKFDGLSVDGENAKYQQGDVWPIDAVVLDESSMLKSFGPRKFSVLRCFDGCRYKLACSATPAPNQRTEFAQHALFLGQVRSTTEYLTAYFVSRDGDWTFKPHSFDAWVANLASWAVFVRDPKAWGFADHLADLPPMSEEFPKIALTDEQIDAAARYETGDQPSILGATPGGITSRTKMMQIAHGFELASGKIAARYPTFKPEWIASLAIDNVSRGHQVIVWVTFDEEGDQLAELIPGAMHLSGRTPKKVRDSTIEAFRSGGGVCTCPTTERGTKPIKSTSANTAVAPKSERQRTKRNGASTPMTPADAPKPSRMLDDGENRIPKLTSPIDSSPTASRPTTTGGCLPSRAEDAPSVADHRTETASGITSTTATPPDESEVCSAVTAISASAISPTIPNDSNGPCPTCGSSGRVLILKPAMFAYGLNLQSCSVQIFSTITDSFERYYQCVRRSHRYGQTNPVRVYVPLTPLDEAICANTMAKQATFAADARALEDAVVGKLRPKDTSEVRMAVPVPQVEIDRSAGEDWTLIHGDCIAHLQHLAQLDEHPTFDHVVFSPPFAALYAYSRELGDMGNTRADAEFRLQWRWFAEALLPLVRPGRVVAIHCKEIIRFANTHGYRHCYDFPAELRDGMVDAGFRYQRRITIWKNPQLEATRNKETSLLHVTALRDASDAFPQTGEYLMVFTAPGDNDIRVTHERSEWAFEHHTEVMNSIWPEPEPTGDDEALMVQWLDPDGTGSVWTGIRETDVLTAKTAKERPDEKHVCPLQLGLIDRCVSLWSNPGELVLSPFAGIGSEGWSALGLGRRFYGIELKRSYFDTAARNLRAREVEQSSRISLFDGAA